jgi:hypothetical protein
MNILNDNSITTDTSTAAQPASQTPAGGVLPRLVIREETNLEKPYKYRVVDGWAELIQRYPWEWFVTLTFTESIHPEASLKVMRVWISMLNRELFGRRWYKKEPYGVYWIAAIEMQKRDVIHLHLLMNGVKDTRRLTYMDIWASMGNKNGYSRIYPVESQIAVSRYLSKYVAKDGEIFMSDNLPDMTSGFERLWSESSISDSLSETDNPQN